MCELIGLVTDCLPITVYIEYDHHSVTLLVLNTNLGDPMFPAKLRFDILRIPVHCFLILIIS